MPANSLERADTLRGAQGCRLLRRRKVPHDLPQQSATAGSPAGQRREMLSATTCRPGSRSRSPPSSTSGLSPWPNGWASPPPPSCAGPSPPTSPSSRRSTPNLMENAMTSSTNSKKSNGLQGDLLSGEWQSGAPKRGTGQHIRLTPLGDDQRVAVPGMADFSGGGPAGTYCRDCNHFADKIAVQTGINTIEKTRFGCVIWAQRMAHAAPSPRRDIRLCPSCKHFEKAARRIAPMLHHRQRRDQLQARQHARGPSRVVAPKTTARWGLVVRSAIA